MGKFIFKKIIAKILIISLIITMGGMATLADSISDIIESAES